MALHLHPFRRGFAKGLVAAGTGSRCNLQIAGNTIEHHRRIVIAFVGMAFEAKTAAGPGVVVVCRNERSELVRLAANADRHGYRGIVSFGVAGGLIAGLCPGDWVVASSIHEEQSSLATDAAWSRRLLEAIPEASHAPILGVDSPVAEPATKRALHRATGAAAVDMESHVVARIAAAHGLAFAAVRVIVDPAHRAIPPAAVLGMGQNARADVRAVLREIAARPSQLPPLLRLAFDAFIARTEMNRVRERLGPHFGLVPLPASDAAADLREPVMAPVPRELMLPPHLAR